MVSKDSLVPYVSTNGRKVFFDYQPKSLFQMDDTGAQRKVIIEGLLIESLLVLEETKSFLLIREQELSTLKLKHDELLQQLQNVLGYLNNAVTLINFEITNPYV